MKSKYLTKEQSWDERIAVMESNLSNCHFDYLYFNIALNLCDARDNADYDREKILTRMLEAFKSRDYEGVGLFIGRLRAL